MSRSDESSGAILLNALSAVLAQVTEPVQLLKTILDHAVSQTGADRGVFVEVARSGKLNYRVLHRYEAESLSDEAARYSRSIFQEVLRTGEGILVQKALEDPRFRSKWSVKKFQLVSVLCMPLMVRGEVAALVHLESGRIEHFQEAHRKLVGSLLEVAGPALEALHAARASENRLRKEVEKSRALLAREWSFGRFVGRSASVRELEQKVRKAAATDYPVLLLGETGTGKGVLARVLHHAGPRSQEAFVTVFGPSLEKGMVEPELFGHRKGAFTGATADRPGKVQAAEKGTLFLDEIAELPLEIQPKLLRLLEEKTYERVGDARERKADVRIIAATNHDLEQEVEAGRFRRDLYARLNFIPVRVPPLRERKQDIPLLLRHCLDESSAGRWIEVTEDACDYLIDLDFAWPENVRHLQQLASRLVMEKPEAPVNPADLKRLLGVAGQTTAGEPASPLEVGLPKFLQQTEKAWLEKAMHQYPDLTRAELAKKLKISQSALYKKLRIYGMHD